MQGLHNLYWFIQLISNPKGELGRVGSQGGLLTYLPIMPLAPWHTVGRET